MEEKRRALRMDIEVKIKLNELKTEKPIEGLKKEPIEVVLINASRGGIAFKTSEELKLNTYYDVSLVLWQMETFDTVVEIIRMENYGEKETMYGARYIGITPSDRLKIQIHELLLEQEKKNANI